MLRCKAFFLCILLSVISFQEVYCVKAIFTVCSDSSIKGISQNEEILLNMINDIRRQGKMSLIPLSADLSRVAHVHIKDLIASKPQDNGCSLHSWSSSGKWTACCHSKDQAGVQCMKSKPKEITGYPGNGYELIYWGEESATPADAAELWQQLDASLDMILCKGKWKGYEWKAMGAGLEGGYAVLWLGDVSDKKMEVAGTKSLVVSDQLVTKKPIATDTKDSGIRNFKTEPVGSSKATATKKGSTVSVSENSATKYYLIVASVKTSESANSELERFKSKGYPEAKILEANNVYRIGILTFDDKTKANQKSNELKKDFPGIWIYKK